MTESFTNIMLINDYYYSFRRRKATRSSAFLLHAGRRVPCFCTLRGSRARWRATPSRLALLRRRQRRAAHRQRRKRRSRRCGMFFGFEMMTEYFTNLMNFVLLYYSTRKRRSRDRIKIRAVVVRPGESRSRHRATRSCSCGVTTAAFGAAACTRLQHPRRLRSTP